MKTPRSSGGAFSLGPSMDTIWALTIFGNVTLSLLLLYRGWYVRYGWLYASTIYSVLADLGMWFARYHDAGHYALLFRVVIWISMGFNIAIIFEAHCMGNRRVSMPVEFQLAMELVAFLTERAQLLWTAYRMQCSLRITNLIMILWFLWIFRKKTYYSV